VDLGITVFGPAARAAAKGAHVERHAAGAGLVAGVRRQVVPAAACNVAATTATATTAPALAVRDCTRAMGV